MTREVFYAITLVAVSALAGPALADPGHSGGDRYGHGPGMMMGMGQYGPDDMGGYREGHMGRYAGDMVNPMSMIMRMHGPMTGFGMGMPGQIGPMGGGMMWMMAPDGQWGKSPEDIRETLQGKLKEYDADGDGTLSIGEFETLHSAMIREMMVDRFQYLDADGDGAVTPQEMAAPAARMEHMQELRERMWGVGPQDDDMRRPMGNGRMMDDN